MKVRYIFLVVSSCLLTLPSIEARAGSGSNCTIEVRGKPVDGFLGVANKLLDSPYGKLVHTYLVENLEQCHCLAAHHSNRIGSKDRFPETDGRTFHEMEIADLKYRYVDSETKLEYRGDQDSAKLGDYRDLPSRDLSWTIQSVIRLQEMEHVADQASADRYQRFMPLFDDKDQLWLGPRRRPENATINVMSFDEATGEVIFDARESATLRPIDFDTTTHEQGRALRSLLRLKKEYISTLSRPPLPEEQVACILRERNHRTD